MSSTTLSFPTPASLGSLDHYIQAVNRFPLLSAEQEVEFGRRLRDTNDLDAVQSGVRGSAVPAAAEQRDLVAACREPPEDLVQMDLRAPGQWILPALPVDEEQAH